MMAPAKSTSSTSMSVVNFFRLLTNARTGNVVFAFSALSVAASGVSVCASGCGVSRDAFVAGSVALSSLSCVFFCKLSEADRC